MNPLITIIVPVYNKSKYLKLCLDSINSQTLYEYELLLIDDGSTDGSAEILKEYSDIDDRIKVITTEHKGASSARNTGIDNATGRYLCFVDADDFINKNYLYELRNNIEDYDCVCCNVKIENAVQNNNPANVPNSVIDNEKAIIYALTLSDDQIYGSQCGKLFKKQIINDYNIRFDEESSYCEDVLFVIEYMSHCNNKILWINKNLYFYTKRSDGLSKSRYIKIDIPKDDCITEYETLNKCSKYITHWKHAKNVYNTRLAKAAVATIRENIIKKQNIRNKELIKIIRKQCIKCIFSQTVSFRNKTSIFLCSISPKLEAKLWLKEEGELSL